MLRKHFFRFALALAAGSVLPFASALHGDFVWDDVAHIADNPAITDWSGAASYFTRLEGRYFRPLVFLSYALDYQLHGLSAWGFHLGNLLLHSANVLLVALLARRSGLSTSAALAAAAVFALHPLQADAVAYISGRTDLMMTLGSLLACLAAIGPGPSAARGLGAATGTAIAILSKESGFGVVPVLLYVAWIRESQPSQRAALVAPSVVVAVVLLATRPTGGTDPVLGTPSLLAAGASLATYLELLLVPTGLHVDRVTLWPESTTARILTTAIAVVVPLAMLGIARVLAHTRLWALWAFAFYLPVANLVPLYPAFLERGLFTAEHNLYAPLAGIAAVAALGVTKLLAGSAIRTATMAVFTLLLAAWSVQTWRHCLDWRDEPTLFAAAAAAGAESPRVWFNLGNTHLRSGRLDEAADAYRRVLASTPRDAPAWTNLAIALQRARHSDEALDAYRRALEIAPEDARIHENLAKLHLQRGDPTAAKRAFGEALALAPGSVDARHALEVLRRIDPEP